MGYKIYKLSSTLEADTSSVRSIMYVHSIRKRKMCYGKAKQKKNGRHKGHFNRNIFLMLGSVGCAMCMQKFCKGAKKKVRIVVVQ